ncbi:MFS transporter [Pseudonocardia spinosispora]|uniref:MFS transporter n=1 Tax=Pseudonocardia spinosispora TaxID=103441 RepID=UPI000490861D|nr:MFS transporter [Pseudonocardia spinosispora]
MTDHAVPSPRSVGLAVYLPSLLFGIGQGAVVPLVALSATTRGASVGMAAVAVAAMGVGKLLGDVPAGNLAARLGERRAMLIATVVAVAGLALCLVAPDVITLCAGLGLVGVSSAVWSLARQAYLTEVMPYRLRGRALSLLGGMQRVGLFVGPFLAAAVTGPLGLAGGYWVHVAAALLAGGVLVVVPDRDVRKLEPGPDGHCVADTVTRSSTRILRDHLRVFATIGMGSLTISAVRTARQVVVPLWADQIGMTPTAASVVFGLSGAMEIATVYPGGLAMDRLGRRWVVTVSMAGLGLALSVVPLATTPVLLAALASVMGLANGLGSGLNMTLGADVSPAVGRQVFLGAWRFCTDIGNGLGPVVIGAVSAVSALAQASMVMGGTAVVCAAAMRRWLPRPDLPLKG